MKKLIFTLFLLSVLNLALPYEANAMTYAKGVILNGQQIQMDSMPIIENGRTLVPMRGVLEAIGANVNWDSSTKTATAFFAENSASVTIDRFTAYTNGTPTTLEVPAKIVNGRTMVPLRFMAEALGYDVSFSEGWVYLDTPISNDFDYILQVFDEEIVQPRLSSEEVIVTTGYNEEYNAVVVSIIGEGVAEGLKILANDKKNELEWDAFLDDGIDFSKYIVFYFYEHNYDVNGILEVIDDQDDEYSIIEIFNGVITYDGVVE